MVNAQTLVYSAKNMLECMCKIKQQLERRFTYMTTNIPKMMTVREIAATGVLTETAIRRLLREGKLPAIYSGKKAFINFDLMCEMLANLKPAS